jgi:hypothetical protein
MALTTHYGLAADAVEIRLPGGAALEGGAWCHPAPGCQRAPGSGGGNPAPDRAGGEVGRRLNQK